MHAMRTLGVSVGLCVSMLTAAILCSAPSAALAQADDATVAPDSQTVPAQMAGTWTGSIDDVKYGVGTLTLDLTQIKSTVGGTFSIEWPQDSPSGTVKGSAKGEKVKLTVTATNQPHACTVKLTGKVLTLDEYTGSYKAIGNSRHCKAKGTFDVILQP